MKRSLAAAALLAASCAVPRRVTAPAPAEPEVLYYSDLGPSEIDVSGYPEKQKANYAVYARACSRCHGLARSVNAPTTSRAWWEFYVAGMRLRGFMAGDPLTPDERAAVLDFLEYDGRARKVKGAKRFSAQSAELKRRFEALVSERMSRLQSGAQPVLPR